MCRPLVYKYIIIIIIIYSNIPTSIIWKSLMLHCYKVTMLQMIVCWYGMTRIETLSSWCDRAATVSCSGNIKRPFSDGHVHSRKNGGTLIICCKDRPYFRTIQLFWDFFVEKAENRGLYRIIFVFLHRPNLSLRAKGRQRHIGKATLYALFLAAWTTTIKDRSKTIAEVTPTDVYIRSRSVPRANHAL